MTTNQFLPFGLNAAASDTLTPTAYAADSGVQTGNVKPLGRNELVNACARQTSTMSTVLAQFIADEAQVDVLDDGDITKKVTDLKTAITNTVSSNIGVMTPTSNGVGHPDGTSILVDGSGKFYVNPSLLPGSVIQTTGIMYNVPYTSSIVNFSFTLGQQNPSIGQWAFDWVNSKYVTPQNFVFEKGYLYNLTLYFKTDSSFIQFLSKNINIDNLVENVDQFIINVGPINNDPQKTRMVMAFSTENGYSNLGWNIDFNRVDNKTIYNVSDYYFINGTDQSKSILPKISWPIAERYQYKLTDSQHFDIGYFQSLPISSQNPHIATISEIISSFGAWLILIEKVVL